MWPQRQSLETPCHVASLADSCCHCCFHSDSGFFLKDRATSGCALCPARLQDHTGPFQGLYPGQSQLTFFATPTARKQVNLLNKTPAIRVEARVQVIMRLGKPYRVRYQLFGWFKISSSFSRASAQKSVRPQIPGSSFTKAHGPRSSAPTGKGEQVRKGAHSLEWSLLHL